MVFFAGVALILHTILETVAESRVRVVATALAQEKLETARNLPFMDVGTVGGIPPGSIPQREVVVVNGQDYIVKTGVVYIDDPFDGLAPDDPIPTDYKRVRVSVEWGGLFPSKKPLVMLGDVAPKGLETIENAGTLSVLVFDAFGEPVANATVHIEANSVFPPVDLDVLTDATGRVFLPGAPECIECYRITVSKPGYSSERTYGVEEVDNPAKPHITILEAEVREVFFAIDVLSDVTITTTRTREFEYAPQPGVSFNLRGSKKIGTNALGDPVYKYEQSFVSNALGQVVVNDLEWDAYEVFLSETSAYDFAGSNPLTPFVLSPGVVETFRMVTTPDSARSLLVVVTDGGGVSLPGAIVTASGAALATQAAGAVDAPDEGQSFFEALSPLVYQIMVSLTGYETATNSVTISGDELTTVILSQP